MAGWLQAQNSAALWDDSRIASIYVSIPTDSLDSIFANPYGTHYFLSEVIFDDGIARDTISQVGLRLRGNTSRSAAKKSYKLSFNTYVPGGRYQGVKKLNLNAQHNDPTMIREKLFYEVWGKCGMPARRTTFVQLYINQTRYGLYTCLEELDKEWLSTVFGENDGNLYKCTYPADLAYLGTNQQAYKNVPSSSATGGRAYDLQTNESLDDYSDFVDLLSLLNQTPNAQFAADIPLQLDVDAVLYALAIDVATGNWDDYAYNQNNYFLYHHLGSGQMEFITYDTDNTFGVDWVQRDWATRDCRDWFSHSGPRPLVTKLLDVPAFQSRYYAILDSVTRFVTRPDSIFPRIDALKGLIAGAALVDTFRTLDYGYTYADFELGFTGTVDGHTPYGIKPFLENRYLNTLNQLGSVSVASPTLDRDHLVLFPNPVNDRLQVIALTAPKTTMLVQVLDPLGRVVIEAEWLAQHTSFELGTSSLISGSYHLLLNSPQGRIALPFVKL